MVRTLAGGRRDAKLGITPSGKSIWLEKHPSEYKGWSASDHLYAAIIHGANRTRGGEIADAHRALAGKSRAISPADVAEAHRTGSSLAGRRSHSTKKPHVMEATAGFSVHTDHQDVIEDNARERFGPNYGDAAERAKRMKAGLVDAQGKITARGWEQLNKDISTLERNALAWLRKIYGRASDQGHDSYGDLIGGLSFDPRSPVQAHNIVMGKDERVDFNDASYGDFARSVGAWKGVSTFGQNVLGGHITFFDIQPPEAFEIAEEAADRKKRR